ncbi:MAG: hypothetical protein Q9163_000784 [Psora crenata]
MAFTASVAGASNVQTQTGPDLEEITTDAIGFQTIAGEVKLRLFLSPWPADFLPPPTASLLGVASRKGLLAAAGPDSVVVASTETVRQAYVASGDGNVKSFTAQLTLNIGRRISQVAFSADEEFLILSAENGGGLAVYQTQSLMQGVTQSAFELATNGVSVRALVPNPTADKAELLAVVTTNGQLMMANLKARQFVSGLQGHNLKDGVSCASWSTRGKQLVAGLGDGTCFQMTPEGDGKAELPAPPGLESDQYVSSILWLENDIFLVAHTPSSFDSAMAPVTTYHIITRAKSPETSILFQKLPDASPPFGLNRSPPFQFMQRLKDFPPNLTDVIVVSSTASTDIGLITRSKAALTGDFPVERTVNVFTTTTMAEDSRRAQLPLTEELSDTSPIGVAFDLSSKDKVKRPLPQEEFEESPGPLPALMVLNNQGLLSTWWIVYAESIRQGTTFPGLAIAGSVQSQQALQSQRQVSPFASSSPSPAPAFGKLSTPVGAFGGSTSTAPTSLGSTSTSAFPFGAPSGLGQQRSLWANSSNNNGGAQASTPNYRQPSFGSSTPLGPTVQGTAFGMAGGHAHKPSPWATTSSGTAIGATEAIGQPRRLDSQPSPFASPSTGGVFGSNVASNNSAPSGGFASFATKSSGFLSATPSSGGSQSIFGKSSGGIPFGSGMDTGSSSGRQQTKDEEAKSLFAGKAGVFELGSTFKADGPAANDAPKPGDDVAGSMFGNDFRSMLGKAAGSHQNDADMNDEDEAAPGASATTGQDRKDVLTSAPKKEQSKLLFPKTDPPESGGLFGTQSQSETTPAEVQNSKPTSSSFGKSTPISTTPNETPKKPEDPLRESIEASKNKEELQSDDDNISPLNEEELQPPEGYGDVDSGASSRSKTPETPALAKNKLSDAPLPPESTSKASYAPGDSSNSSKSSDDAPLPPEFAPAKSKLKEVETAPPEQAQLPSDVEEGALDDEGSGVDVGQEISPSNSNQSSKNTPGSSFGQPRDKSPPASLFSSTPKQSDAQRSTSALFGEVSKAAAPFFPPPTKALGSPRSPSPVRLSSSADLLRPDNIRSISAPGPQNPFGNRHGQSSRLAVALNSQRPTVELHKHDHEPLVAERTEKTTEDHQELIDDEDVQIRRLLNSDVTGSKTLDPFLAHQDYVGNIDKPGIPGQIEKIFRDINSMIDTLGLNARSLKAFVKGHEEQAKPNERTRDDLEDPDDWCLLEIGDLDGIEMEVSEQLESNQLQDVPGKLATCRDLQKDLSRQRHKSHALGRTVKLRKDPLAAEVAAQAPLTLDQQTQQYDIRKSFKYFQNQLAKAEEAASLLRAKVVHAEAHSSKSGSNGKDILKQPTVEAVQNTIRKMTAMVQKKRDDIDMLEMQMRGLRFSTPPTDGASEAIDPIGGGEGSSFSLTRPNLTSAGRRYKYPLQNGYMPSSAMVPHQQTPFGEDLQGRGTPGKDQRFLNEEERESYRAKAKQRKEINGIVMNVLGKGKVKIRPLD